MSAEAKASVVAEGATQQTRAISFSSRAVVLAVIAITFLAYCGTLAYEFVYDDRGQIVDNPFILSWGYLPRYFTEHVWGHVDPTMLGNYYRPMFLIWLLVNRTLFGLHASWWHLTTILAHVGVTVMVFALARRLTQSLPAAAIAALIFGLHPTHIESIAWISGVTDPLLALFFIPSFWFYLNWREAKSGEDHKATLSRRPTFYLAMSLIFFVLAMLSKETALVMPALVFGTEWIYGDGPFIRRVIAALRPAVLYAVLIIPYLFVRSAVLKGLGHEQSPVSMLTTVKTWPAVLWFYVTHLVWPMNLSCFYDLDFVTQPGLTNFVLPLAGLAVIAAGLWLISRRAARETRRTVAVACLWLTLPILPVLNLSVFANGELVHDRYLYLPVFGLGLLVGLGLSRLQTSGAQLFGQPALRFAAVLAIVLGLGFATVSQHQYWASELLLFQHGLTVAPNSRIAKTGLANVLSDRGYFNEAVGMYDEVIARYPTNWKSINNLGCTYLKMGRFNDAETTLLRGIELRPHVPKQYISLSVALQELGRLTDAERAADKAISLDANGYGFHYQRGDVLEAQGRLTEALDTYQQEVARHPDFAQAREKIAALQSRTATETGGTK
ncbi:MAG TPA: tetratricopeptide repeat protein [Blastocatellia bacterium]|nr:tetratricopeptide repeat protein [Blastocatellia bacterium]